MTKYMDLFLRFSQNSLCIEWCISSYTLVRVEVKQIVVVLKENKLDLKYWIYDEMIKFIKYKTNQ